MMTHIFPGYIVEMAFELHRNKYISVYVGGSLRFTETYIIHGGWRY